LELTIKYCYINRTQTCSIMNWLIHTVEWQQQKLMEAYFLILDGNKHVAALKLVSRIRVVRSLVFCVMFCLSLFVLYRLDIALFALRFTVTSLESSNFLTLGNQRKMSKPITSILKVSTYTFTSIPACPIRLAVILLEISLCSLRYLLSTNIVES
jgi:hypothetical protein